MVKISALPGLLVFPCRFTSKRRRAAPARSGIPVCLLQVGPAYRMGRPSKHSGETDGLKPAGRAGGPERSSLGRQPGQLEYSLYLFSGDGAKVKGRRRRAT